MKPTSLFAVQLMNVIVAMDPLAASAQPLHYVARDMGTLGGPTAQAFGINNAGRVVGASTLPDANVNGFVWDGVATKLPPLAGDFQATAFSINDDGKIAVVSYDLGELIPHGFLWDSSGTVDLGDLAPRDLNNSELIVGSRTLNDSTFGLIERAARWENGTTSDLATLGGNYSRASAVSDGGRIVGMSYTPGDMSPRATLWQNGVAIDLGTLGGAGSYAYDINNAGQIVGIADLSDNSAHAFLFQVNNSGQVSARTDLGVLNNASSCAFAINANGQIVGTSDARAFLWTLGAMVDLNTTLNPISNWRLEQAWGLNDGGQIVGAGLHFGSPRAFLLTPGTSGDAGGDGLVTEADLASFFECELGPTGEIAGMCYIHDFDGDGDVDLHDFQGFQLVFDVP